MVAKKRPKKTTQHTMFMWAVLAAVILTGAFSFSMGFSADPGRQVAVGAASDAMCMGGADAKCQCGKGLKDGKCDPQKKGGGKIGCPCSDTTSGDQAASGKCATVGKCKADKADGMPPMLPMIPMMMPMMPMMPMPSCPPKTATSTTATTTAASSTSSAIMDSSFVKPSTDPNCSDQGGNSGSGSPFWYPDYSGAANSGVSANISQSNNTSDFSSDSSGSSGSVWASLLNSLGLGSGNSDAGAGDQSSGTSYSVTGVGQVSSHGANAPGTTQNASSSYGYYTANGQTFVTNDLSGNTSQNTFTFQGSVNAFGTTVAGSATTILATLASTLRSLLAIIASWTK